MVDVLRLKGSTQNSSLPALGDQLSFPIQYKIAILSEISQNHLALNLAPC